MTKTQSAERSIRPYTAPRLIRPDAKGLSPEGKAGFAPAEYSIPSIGPYGPS